ncbi:hypothetical protein GKZ89_13195 [Bacillus mangrovi]|uniref:Uncharacterized protein n=1 Tax=Metabacillus mangrovi TaxID=1491830 RepID=A0A7X2V5E1_9BACI|nr:hypothetical protein [Metabacillus mangrovi]MTH54360.1 hypothetical protein [Metabacillus mangrovi]
MIMFSNCIFRHIALGQRVTLTYDGGLFLRGRYQGTEGNAVLISIGGSIVRVNARTINAIAT